MTKYNPKEIEPKWQKFWEENKTFFVTEDKTKPKFYALIEFPYPSGAGLHVGHPRSYTAMDVIARKKRMLGYNVLYPIGFDAFGLPTENYAIKTKRHPADVTQENIANFTRQLKSLGFSFDWSRSVDTTDPNYYKWTQWIFLEFFKNGLAYKTNMPINWCLNCKIGLANEEVVNGACERCGGPVEKRDKEQWMLAITKYANSLLQGLEEVDYIPQAKIQQTNWIGRSVGAEITWDVYIGNKKIDITTFTTRPDTLFGATYLVVAPEHKIIKTILEDNNNFVCENKNEILEYVKNSKTKSDLERSALQKEKTGIELIGVFAKHPITQEQIPVYVADYVLVSYGTGAIMAVPSHDERDFEFAKKYNLQIKQVVAPYICLKSFPPKDDKQTQTRNVITAIIKHKTTGEYLIQERIDGGRGFTGGGIENNETSIEALKREIQEETGFANIVSSSKITEMVGHGFKAKKDINCFDPDTVYFVEVDGEPSFELSNEDKNLHKIVWKKEEEVEAFINLEHHSFAWKCYKSKVECFSDEGISINSDFLNWLKTQDAIQKITQYLEKQNLGKKKINYKLRDWVFSRQRYWGEPIPLVYCASCKDLVLQNPQNFNKGEVLNPGWFCVSTNELPIKLPNIEKYQPTDTGESPLSQIQDWVNATCPYCGKLAKRETDTMPNWAGSSWYFLAYTMQKNNKEYIWNKETMNYWGAIDWYNGGMEHTVLHLLYSRFWNQFLYDAGHISSKEPYKKRTSHGMILAKSGDKMSKSKGNVVNPDEMIELYGADSLRTYIMFMGPFDQAVEWDTNGLIGVRRFLDRVFSFSQKIENNNIDEFIKTNIEFKKILSLTHKTIKIVTNDIEEMNFNTAIARLMEFSNELSKLKTIPIDIYRILIKLLSPFAPHLCEELWLNFGDNKKQSSVTFTSWPSFDEILCIDDKVIIGVQVNGKLRDTIEFLSTNTEEEIKEKVLASQKVQKYIDGKEIKKFIVIKGKMVSIVV